MKATVLMRCHRAAPRTDNVPRDVARALGVSAGADCPPDGVAEPDSPLRLYERGIWDPADQYWGEPDGMLEMCLVEMIAGGPRLQFEFEQLLPGGEDPDAPDPILDAIELRDRGQPDRARALLEGLMEWDARCLDAHAHLGGLAFDQVLADTEDGDAGDTMDGDEGSSANLRNKPGRGEVVGVGRFWCRGSGGWARCLCHDSA